MQTHAAPRSDHNSAQITTAKWTNPQGTTTHKSDNNEKRVKTQFYNSLDSVPLLLSGNKSYLKRKFTSKTVRTTHAS
jgi:hypothetical protein